MLALTRDTPEVAWRALALATAAQTAALPDSMALAYEYIDKALTLVSTAQIPVAGWQVHAAAAEIYEMAGNQKARPQHRELSRAAILALADSLPAEHELRKAFLSAPPVVKILGNGPVG